MMTTLKNPQKIFIAYIYIQINIHKHIHKAVRHNIVRVEDDKLRTRNVINKDYS